MSAHMRRRKLGLALTIFCFCLVASISWSKSPSSSSNTSETASDREQLLALSREAVEAQNDILVTGEVGASLSKRDKALLYRDAIQRNIANLVHRKKELSKKKNDYKAHKTEVRVKGTKFKGTRATQIVSEYVVLSLDPSIGGPKETEYVQEHELEYIKEGAFWRMVSARVLPPPTMTEEISAPADDPPTVEAPSSQLSRISMSQVQVSTEALSASYSRDNAVYYALKYWGPYTSNYNTQYRSYTNDCTNFTSQAIRYGGWPFDQVGSRTAPDTWYYTNYSWTTSYSWAAAHNFHQFFGQSGRGYAARYFSDMFKGDLLQADFGPTPDGNISHSMIVTAKDSSGTIYLTYHSNNTKNRSITDLRLANPGTNWYGKRLYVGF